MPRLWDNWKDVAEACGVDQQLFEARIWFYRPKWDVYTAATTPKKRTGRPPIVKNSEWDKWKRIALKNGVSEQLFKARIWSYTPKWDPRTAAKTPKMKYKAKGIMKF